MSKLKDFIMQVEDVVYQHITEDMVSECEHISELYEKVTKSIYVKEPNKDMLLGMWDDVVRDVCDDCWNEYWSKYA